MNIIAYNKSPIQRVKKPRKEKDTLRVHGPPWGFGGGSLLPGRSLRAAKLPAKCAGALFLGRFVIVSLFFCWVWGLGF